MCIYVCMYWWDFGFDRDFDLKPVCELFVPLGILGILLEPGSGFPTRVG